MPVAETLGEFREAAVDESAVLPGWHDSIRELVIARGVLGFTSTVHTNKQFGMVVADCPGGEAIVVQIDGPSTRQARVALWCAARACAEARGSRCGSRVDVLGRLLVFDTI